MHGIIFAPVAQWIEQWISNPLVAGSIPAGCANLKMKNIKKLTKLLGYSVQAMAIDLDISKSYFHQIKAGDVPLPAKIAYKFAVMFNVHPICLMDDSLPLLDCEGKEYTIKSYKDRNQQQENLNHELKNLIDNLATPSNGAFAVIKACLLTHMRDIVNQMDGLQYKFEDRFKVPIPATPVL